MGRWWSKGLISEKSVYSVPPHICILITDLERIISDNLHITMDDAELNFAAPSGATAIRQLAPKKGGRWTDRWVRCRVC